MFVYLRTKFQVSSKIITSFRQEVPLPLTNPRQSPKKPTQIKVKTAAYFLFEKRQQFFRE